MKLPPKIITFWISILPGVLGFLGAIATIPLLSGFDFWLLFAGFVAVGFSSIR